MANKSEEMNNFLSNQENVNWYVNIIKIFSFNCLLKIKK